MREENKRSLIHLTPDSWASGGARPIGGMRFDASTPSSSIGGQNEIALVVDFADNSIRVTPGAGFPQPWESEGLSSVLSFARDYMQGAGKMWQVFAGHRVGEIYIEPAERTGGSFVQLVGLTDAISDSPFRRDVVPVGVDTRETFGKLAKEWKGSRNRFSSGTEMFMHPAYQQIVGMGNAVLALIFEELNRELDHWFWALKAITRADPVSPADVGNLAAMRTHWLRWAKEHGYQWERNSTSTPDIRRHFPPYRISTTA